MSALSLLLARHGRVAEPWPDRLYGDLDVPLSELGRAQSRALAERLADLPLRAVVSSHLQRAVHAAELVHARRPQAVRLVEPRLAELARGAWAGLGRDEVEACAPGAWDVWRRSGGAEPPPGGEPLADLARRVAAALDELAGRFAPGPVLVLTHKWVIRVALAHALGLPVSRTPRLAVAPCGWAELAWTPAGAARLLALHPAPATAPRAPA